MQKKLGIIVLVAVTVLLCFVAMQVMAAESTVTLKQLPKAVRATLLAKAKGGKILEIEKDVAKTGTTYSADVQFGKRIFDIEIAANGKFLGKEEDKPVAPKAKATAKPKGESDEAGEAGEAGETAKPAANSEALEPGESIVKFAELPAAVKATLTKWAGKGGKIDGIEKSGTGAKTVYEADVTKAGKAYDVSVSAAGKFMGATPEPAATAKPEADEKGESGEKE